MPLLTKAQIANATEEELLHLVREINRRLSDINTVAVLSTAKQTLAKFGATNVSRVTFGVEQWDNGYFWSGIRKVEAMSGAELQLPDLVMDALSDALDEPLTNMAHDDGPLGRFDQLTIDVVNDRVLT